MVVQLNIHSCYDLLQSTIRIKELAAAAKADGQHALALTDTHVLFGVQAFYETCIAEQIKPIIGMTVHLTDGSHEFDAVILAKNQTGYDNLLKLSSKIQLKGLTTVPLTLFDSYRQQTVVIFKQLPAALSHLVDDESYACHLSAVADDKKVYLAAVRYMKPSGLKDLTVLQAIDSNEKLMLESLGNRTGDDYFKTCEQLAALDINEDYMARTEEIAALCHVTIEALQKLPKFKTPDNETSDDYLWSLIEHGRQKIKHFDERYEQRVQHEYRIITQMGFSDYFLIVGDLINYAKSQHILVGPGRGSSGGSLISYLLNITMIDPIEHGLFFERFLNPERVTMPDIDIDFEDTRREEVIRYCIDKYGAFNVSGIVTFGHLLARAVMRDVGRILQFSDDDLKYVSHLMPKKLGLTLNDAYQLDDFKAFVNKDDRHQQWFEIACQLEGLPRHTSTHAAGIIIHDQLLTDYVPLLPGDGINLTQWTMTEVERLGLLKIDFLGLRNLTIIQRVLNQAGIKLTTDTIRYDDQDVFRGLSAADTSGVFQLESEGMRNVLRRLQPESFEDIVAVLSLYRPGPMEQIPLYIDRRHGAPVTYLHPDLEPILGKTYGVIIYQEQIMQIASRFAGFSLGEADNLRRAMSKKKRDVLEAEKQHFIAGSETNGYDRETAEQIYQLILKFADYGFPRAHAVAYSQIAYIMMYLKVHYPAFFYAAIMSNVIGSEDKTAAFISELKTKNIPYTKPSINSSHWFVRAVDGSVVLSLGMIKGIGYRTVMDIIDERKNGPFTDLYDVIHRLPAKTVTRPVLEALILTGAFDEFELNRATLLASLDEALNTGGRTEGDHFLEDLGFSLKKKYRHHEEMTEEQQAALEFDHLGFFLSEHPVEKLFSAHLYLPLYQIQQAAAGRYILAAVSAVRRIRTKKGQPMAFAKVMDGVKELELVIFPDVFKTVEAVLQKNAVVVIKGKFDKEKLIVDMVQSFDSFKTHYMNQLKEIYVLKKPELPLGQGPIKLFEYSMATGTSEQLAMIDKTTAGQLLETYPPEMIRVI
ncbi:DNA polymerase III subunit alpha [Macrococcus equipercicus]|uniref:DNA-directed DNA polymerase n=1 Tax=Macrococcus equipercicus TaxID=69967 RepID=A0A9Q9F195_9STAP|nr:DNA polymerase III subunit alpha [Macrococcus equipercicus]KAA1039898.1 DNA polymerase III subunit alpha [Macrococcus equipercicus]UTH13151.1 DNA polymerase III subunit alpha [Macrococcus equipercicus]